MYKVIKDSYVIDVLADITYVRMNSRNNVMIQCKENNAQGIMGTNGDIWHLSNLESFPTGNYDVVSLAAIEETEYNELRESIDNNVTVTDISTDVESFPSLPHKVISYERLQQQLVQNAHRISQLDSKVNPVVNISAMTLEQAKEVKQDENKRLLKEFFEENPLLWQDGNYYGVTESDQSEMIADLTLYNLKQSLGQVSWKLEWHDKHKACHEFTVENFYLLINAIADFVYPYRRLQEYYKEMVYSCETMEELLALEFVYDAENLSNLV